MTPAASTLAGWSPHDSFLVSAAAAAVVAVVLLIGVAKVHPFLALTATSLALGLGAGLPADRTVGAFQRGVGDTLGSVGVVIALGAMLGKLMAVSGGAERIVSRLVERASPAAVPWAMALAAMAVGFPMFFEVGVVLVVPIVAVVARRTGLPALRVGLPALAGLSVLHGLVPPHPAPLLAASLLNADVGRTLALGLVVAIPTVALAGPVFGGWVGRRIGLDAAEPGLDARAETPDGNGALPGAGRPDRGRRAACRGASCPPAAVDPPGFRTSLATLLLPAGLMMLRAAVDVVGPNGRFRAFADFAGQPVVALLSAVLLAMFTFGLCRGLELGRLGPLLGESLAPVAGIIMIVGAGGGFKQTLVDSGVGEAIGRAATGSSLAPLLLGWLVAVAIRVATGSATVATLTAAGIMAPIGSALHPVDPSLLALSIGCGSLFFSHVNDAGFWLVKEYFGLTVVETLASWSVMETIISVAGMLCVLALGMVR